MKKIIIFAFLTSTSIMHGAGKPETSTTSAAPATATTPLTGKQLAQQAAKKAAKRAGRECAKCCAFSLTKLAQGFAALGKSMEARLQDAHSD